MWLLNFLLDIGGLALAMGRLLSYLYHSLLFMLQISQIGWPWFSLSKVGSGEWAWPLLWPQLVVDSHNIYCCWAFLLAWDNNNSYVYRKAATYFYQARVRMCQNGWPCFSLILINSWWWWMI